MISGQKNTCSKGDKITTSKACPNFRTNIEAVQKSDLQLIGELIDKLDQPALRALSILMHGASKTSKTGLKFMQKVFVRYRGIANRNYISNFMECYVMEASHTYVRLTSSDGRCVLTYNENCFPHIFTEEDFSELKEEMFAKGNLIDPDTQSLIARKLRNEEEHELQISADSLLGEVTTIDSVFVSSDVKKKRKSGIKTLVEAVDSVVNGKTERKPKRKRNSVTTVDGIRVTELG